VRVSFPVTQNRRRDADNPAPTVKAIVDGLVDAGMWPDDTPEWVETLGSRFVKGATEVVVEIIPRGEMAA
jgi:Holliday junction resolvase RusA-like endonuclease